jgi:hypothetical protein
MGNFSRQVKRNAGKQVEIHKELYNRGWKDGAKHQLENDIQVMINILTKLEKAEGIGEKTATKVREFFLEEMGRN